MEVLTDDIKHANRIREAARAGYNAFLNALDDHDRVEWVDGEPVFMSPVPVRHLEITAFLMFLTYEYFRRHPIGEIYHVPTILREAGIVPE